MWGNRAKGNKFGNTKVKKAGFTFDSQAESALHSLLSLQERAGEIRGLTHHPKTVYLTVARVGYRPDFCWIDVKSGQLIYGEMKGFENDVWRIKKKLWTYYGPGPLQIWKPGGGGPALVEVIHPKPTAPREPLEAEE